jgi:hypothetical protein
VGGLVSDRHKSPLTRRFVVHYCSAVHNRRLLVNIDTGSDPYVDFRNIAIKADGYPGQSVTLGYKKDDNTNATLTFRRGLLTSYT